MGEQKQSNALQKVVGFIRAQTKLNYYHCHLAYFVITILVSSVVIYGSNKSASDPGNERVRYIDSLFLATSAMTTTGLNTIDLNVMTGYQQSVLFVLMILGDLSTVSLSMVVIRRWFFRRRMSSMVTSSKHAQKMVANVDEELAQRHAPSEASMRRRTKGTTNPTSPQDQPSDNTQDRLRKPWRTPSKQGQQQHDHHYLSFEPRLDKKGRFGQLSEAENAELGGVEYRALKLLCWLLPLHTAGWILTLTMILGPYAARYGPVATLLHDSQPGELSPGWWGVFISTSAYTNCGLDLFSVSMIPFQSNWLILIVTGAGVIAGNTFYPIFLRLYIWIFSKVIPKGSELHHSTAFLLQHPRRCYLWLFDGKTTWILLLTQICLIFGEWVLFEILNIHQTAIAALPTGTKIMDGLYQSFGTRSSGFFIVTISSLAPAIQIIYMLMMYFSVFPILISLRTTNVYEERSIGLNADQLDARDDNGDVKKGQDGKPKKAYGMHIQNQLAYDLWIIALAWILICIVEEPQLNTDAAGFTEFAILFEIVSAYGNCGLSLGVPYAYYSLCGQFHTLSKLILLPVMIRGRHRILPLAIDRSVMLPGQSLMEDLDKHYHGLKDERDVEEKIRENERGAQAEKVGMPHQQDPDSNDTQ